MDKGVRKLFFCTQKDQPHSSAMMKIEIWNMDTVSHLLSILNTTVFLISTKEHHAKKKKVSCTFFVKEKR